ncbi:uncharacterized protein ACA1_255390 [Acanthamoeba castellanii str. Neff]|uniref:Uncharacterized protein n=1 Tax=Acanthamoeba castellanii (strain ATCC 30010 / Neff) TaxID=1257118 RepID=L8HB41_ACACF|nr:uncharacterized protein ACA1_255390 [Acanthamoeba castellanii str. Neff]ELR22430.1 hypothetical protein ACA1_255390 [Acanthamoeba castellanii str. Neff]
MHKAMGKCVPGLGSPSSGLPIDIRYEVRFHSVSGLLELEPGKTVLIVWKQAWGATSKQKGQTTPKLVERHSKKSLKLYVVEPHGTGYRKLYKGRLALAEYTEEVVCAQVGLVLHPCRKDHWNSNPILQMYISSKWVGEEAKQFRSVSRKASAFLEFDFISDHIDQCLKESLKGTQSEIVTLSNDCKTLKKKYRKQQAVIDRALEKLHKEKEVEAIQRHDDATSTQGVLSWEWDLSATTDGSMRHTPRVDERELENEDDEEEGNEETQRAEVSSSSAVVVQTAKVEECAPMGTVAGEYPQVSAATFLTFLAITWAYRELHKRVMEFMLCYFLGAMQLGQRTGR